MKTTKVTIHRDGVFAGDGRWTDDCEIVDCPAILGDDQDASDATYEALCDALASLPQTEDHWRGPVDVERPDGTYTAELTELVVVADSPYRAGSDDSELLQLEQLCHRIASGEQDFDGQDFQQRMRLPENWDWSDIEAKILTGDITAEDVDDAIHAGLRGDPLPEAISYSDAYQTGFAAFAAGDEVNEYSEGTWEHEQWEAGYRDAADRAL